jgi:hypothetical protein
LCGPVTCYVAKTTTQKRALSLVFVGTEVRRYNLKATICIVKF